MIVLMVTQIDRPEKAPGYQLTVIDCLQTLEDREQGFQTFYDLRFSCFFRWRDVDIAR